MEIAKCSVCGFSVSNVEDAEIMFGVDKKIAWNTKRFYHPRCRLCRQTISDDKKIRNRYLAKARNLIYSHIKRFREKNWDIDTKTIHTLYNWPSVEIIARRLENEYQGACHYCSTAYQDEKYMVHGLADLSADIINPKGGPGWDNVRFCCLTCNRIKGTMGAARFMRYLALVKERAAFLKVQPIQLLLDLGI